MKNGNKEITRKYKFGENFPPESIAIVGISRNDNTSIPGYTGLQMFRSLRDTGFKGRLYPVNPKADEIEGVKAYVETLGTRAEEETYNQIMMTLTSAHRQLHNRMHNNGIYHDHTVIDEHHNK